MSDRSAYYREYYRKNKAKRQAYFKEYYRTRAIRAYKKAEIERNHKIEQDKRAQQREKSREYYSKNQEKRRAYYREYYRTHKKARCEYSRERYKNKKGEDENG